MPWTAQDTHRHNKHIKSAKRKRQWAEIANSVLEKTGDEGRAVRTANGVVKKQKKQVAGGHSKAHHKKHKKTHKRIIRKD